jgi:superfamily II DNA or RNA helicase
MKWSKLLNYDISNYDISRYIKQLRAVNIWIKHGCKATVNYSGGVGKTLVGIITIKRMQKTDPNRTVVIIVPTTPLKLQWEKELEKFNIKKANVYVINSALNLKINCNLLILDEVHLMCSTERIKIFNSKYNWILGLTGTFERTDGRENLIKKYCPVCCSLDYYEGIQLGYIEHVKIYKVALTLDNGKEFSFRTDEWDESIIMERVEKSGNKVLQVKRQFICGQDK